MKKLSVLGLGDSSFVTWCMQNTVVQGIFNSFIFVSNLFNIKNPILWMVEAIDVNYLISYGQGLINNSLLGDPTAIVILAGVAILILGVVFGVSAFLFGFIKRFFLVIVIGLSVFFFLSTYGQRLASEGLTGQLIILGVIGIAGAIAALVIAFGAFASHAKKIGQEKKEEPPLPPDYAPTQLQQRSAYTPEAFSPGSLFSSLSNDRSLLAVFSYVIIAQFGVFSSRTISAPNPETGIVFAAIFFVGAFIFIKTTYHDYQKGVKHLLAAAIFGILMSLMLGLFWAEIPMESLFSIAYFETDAMVAFITGIAISLLMGTRD